MPESCIEIFMWLASFPIHQINQELCSPVGSCIKTVHGSPSINQDQMVAVGSMHDSPQPSDSDKVAALLKIFFVHRNERPRSQYYVDQAVPPIDRATGPPWTHCFKMSFELCFEWISGRFHIHF